MNSGYFRPDPTYGLPTGLEVVHLADDQVCLLRLNRGDRPSADGFWAAYHTFVQRCQVQQRRPKLIFRIGDASINPYTRDVALRHIQQYHDLPMSLAMVFMQRTPFAPVLRQMLTTDFAPYLSLCNVEEFRDEEEAIHWILNHP